MNIQSYLTEKKDAIDQCLREQCSFITENNAQGKLREACEYALFPGGKRIRPIICLAVYELLAENSDLDTARVFSICLELIHTYSLIHDDLPCMDDDDLRRGKPTCHKIYGEAIALLAGNALLSHAFTLAAAKGRLSSDYRLLIVQELAEASGFQGLMGGQAADILMEGSVPDEAMVSFIHQHKTARLFQAATTIGGYIAQAPLAEIDNLRVFGIHLGHAFQIQDDILDLTGDEKKAGKRLRKDSTMEKLSITAVIGLEESKNRLKKTFDNCFLCLDRYGKVATSLRELVTYVSQRET